MAVGLRLRSSPASISRLFSASGTPRDAEANAGRGKASVSSVRPVSKSLKNTFVLPGFMREARGRGGATPSQIRPQVLCLIEVQLDSWTCPPYTREALNRGLKYDQQLGVNPFKFGRAYTSPIRYTPAM